MATAVSTSRLLFLSLSFFLTAANRTTTSTTTTNHHIKTLNTTHQHSKTLNTTKPSSPPTHIQKACSTANDKAFCVQTLTSNPKSHGLNITDLAFLAMTMAQDNGTATSKFVSQKLGDENELQPMLDESLGDCEDLYQDAVAMMENAMSAFFTKGKSEVRRWLSAAMMDAMNCEQGLKKSGTEGAMGNRNQVFYKLVSSAWSVYDAAAAVPGFKPHMKN